MFKDYKIDCDGKLLIGGFAYKVAKTMRDQNQMRRDLEQPGAVEILASALEASPVWQSEMSKPGATPESVVEKLGLLNTTRSGFKKITKVEWPF